MNPTVQARSARYLGFGVAYVEADRGLLGLASFEQVRTPFYGLLGHGLELGLKGVIARGGCDDERLIWLGHDLAWAWNLAKAQGVDGENTADVVGEVICRLSRPRYAQAFRYPTLLSWRPPDPWDAVEAAEAYLHRARRLVLEP